MCPALRSHPGIPVLSASKCFPSGLLSSTLALCGSFFTVHTDDTPYTKISVGVKSTSKPLRQELLKQLQTLRLEERKLRVSTDIICVFQTEELEQTAEGKIAPTCAFLQQAAGVDCTTGARLDGSISGKGELERPLQITSTHSLLARTTGQSWKGSGNCGGARNVPAAQTEEDNKHENTVTRELPTKLDSAMQGMREGLGFRVHQ
ncbi:hypothetical protein P7K49_010811 [Saguinus oedipus]|uniref:Uncharacterized protein n=1 Tax=Saguinus oedipus TaxID=9490 RepID=A0ABQ9VNU5_SAGOE|nr:hypothetical protein P7K49_010811 [Saguinus oedipus]